MNVETDAELVTESAPPPSPEAAGATAPPSESTATTAAPASTRGLIGLAAQVYTALLNEGHADMRAFGVGSSVKTYVLFCESKGWTVETAPGDALTQCARAHWKPAGQNAAAHRVLQGLEALRKQGVSYASQSYSPLTGYERPTRKRVTENMDGAGSSGGTVGVVMPGGVGWADTSEVTQPAQPTVQAPAPVHTFAPPPPPQRPQVKPGARPPMFPQGGRIRIQKVATGYEGPGIGAGQRMSVGDYWAQDISNEGTIENFLLKWIVPRYGPFAGQPDTTFIVQKLDDRMNVTLEFPHTVAAPANGGVGGPSMFAQPTGQAAPPPFAGPQGQYHGGHSGGVDPFAEKFLGMLEEQNREARARYAKLEEELKSTKMDPATMMLLLERAKPQEVPYDKLFAEMQKLRPPDPFAPPATPFTPLAQPGPDPFAAASQHQQQMQPLFDALQKTTDKALEIASRPAPAPPPALAAPPPPPDPFSHPLVASLMQATIAKVNAPPPLPTGPSALEQKLDKLIEQMARPQATPTLTQQLADMKAFKETMDELSGANDGPNGFVQVAEMMFENADKIGEMVRSFVGMGKAPQLPTGNPPKALPAGKPQSTKPGVPPAEVQTAIMALRDAPEGEAGEQPIADAIFALIAALHGASAPWPELAQKILGGFAQVDSKPEIRAFVVNVLQNCGARKMITDALVEKVTEVLHKHYSYLHASMMQGKEKRLADAEAPGLQTVDAQPTPANVVKGGAAVNPVAVEAIDVEVEGEEDDQAIAE